MNAYPTLADSREVRRDNDKIISAEHSYKLVEIERPILRTSSPWRNG
jgi:hypothetical protein